MEELDLKKTYMNLLLKKNNLIKEGKEIYIQYIQIFGDSLIRKFEITMEIVKLRKLIAFCIRKQNYGEPIKENELEDYIELEMVSYQNELKTMIDQKEACSNLDTISIYDVKNNKKLYYEIAKKLHPDMHPDASPIMLELFEKATQAYNNNNTEELKRISDIVKFMEDSDADIEDIEEKIVVVKQEIEDIEKSEPYIFKYEFTPMEVAKEALAEIEDEIEAARVVLEELQQQYDLFTIESEVM